MWTGTSEPHDQIDVGCIDKTQHTPLIYLRFNRRGVSSFWPFRGAVSKQKTNLDISTSRRDDSKRHSKITNLQSRRRSCSTGGGVPAAILSFGLSIVRLQKTWVKRWEVHRSILVAVASSIVSLIFIVTRVLHQLILLNSVVCFAMSYSSPELYLWFMGGL